MPFASRQDTFEQTAIEATGTPDDSRTYEPRTVEEQQALDRRFVGSVLDQRFQETGTVSLATAKNHSKEL
ncbi:MAG: hypothetical protein PHH13_05560 [Candidatus Peribacteraceae bacterium]|nr:hypothetical protein [Candidatus Peribacteraceae bacterium]